MKELKKYSHSEILEKLLRKYSMPQTSTLELSEIFHNLSVKNCGECDKIVVSVIQVITFLSRHKVISN